MDERLVAACSNDDTPADTIEAALVAAASQLMHEHELDGVTGAAIAQVEEALHQLRRFEHEAGSGW